MFLALKGSSMGGGGQEELRGERGSPCSGFLFVLMEHDLHVPGPHHVWAEAEEPAEVHHEVGDQHEPHLPLNDVPQPHIPRRAAGQREVVAGKGGWEGCCFAFLCALGSIEWDL